MKFKRRFSPHPAVQQKTFVQRLRVRYIAMHNGRNRCLGPYDNEKHPSGPPWFCWLDQQSERTEALPTTARKVSERNVPCRADLLSCWFGRPASFGLGETDSLGNGRADRGVELVDRIIGKVGIPRRGVLVVVAQQAADHR